MISAVAAIASLSTATTAQAAVLFTSTRSGLGANELVNWSSLGPQNLTGGIANPFTVSSTGGLGVTGQFTGGAGARRDQNPLAPAGPGTVGSGFFTNFAPNEALIWSGGPNGPLTLTFANTVSGAGAQIATTLNASFTGSISAFGTSGNLLGSFTRTGLSADTGAGDALFLGVSSSTTDIKSIVFNAFVRPLDGTPGSGNNFAINQVSLNTLNPTVTANPTAVPEPFTIVGTLVGGTAALRMRKKLKANSKG